MKRSYGNQNPWSTVAEKEERSGRPDIGIDRMKASDYYYHEQFVESFSSASYSKWDDDNQDPEHFPHSAHEPQHVNASVIPVAHGPVVRFLSS